MSVVVVHVLSSNSNAPLQMRLRSCFASGLFNTNHHSLVCIQYRLRHCFSQLSSIDCDAIYGLIQLAMEVLYSLQWAETMRQPEW